VLALWSQESAFFSGEVSDWSAKPRPADLDFMFYQGLMSLFGEADRCVGRTLRLTTDPAAETCPAWSPDDRWIAFSRRQSTDVAVVLMPSLGGPERKLIEIADPSRLSWTPDSKWLAYSTSGYARRLRLPGCAVRTRQVEATPGRWSNLEFSRTNKLSVPKRAFSSLFGDRRNCRFGC
jgi:dipeptidyl aminopeptidase/acylaminoacyl peptidase